MRERRRLTMAICALVLLAGALPALAQPRGPSHGPGSGPGGMAGHRLEHLALRLELSDGQREQLQAAFEERFAAGAEMRQSLFEAHRTLEERVHAETFDEAAIRAAARELAALEADMAVQRARQAQQLRSILTPEQLAELQEMREERRGFAHRGRRGRGGRGGGPGFGGPPPPPPPAE